MDVIKGYVIIAVIMEVGDSRRNYRNWMIIWIIIGLVIIWIITRLGDNRGNFIVP